MEKIYHKFEEELIKAESKDIVKMLYRGFSRDYAYEKFNLNSNTNTFEQFGERIFYFGEKSKHFTVKDQSTKFNINEISISTFSKIFKIYSNLDRSTILKDFYLKNEEAFKFFSRGNKGKFLANVKTLDNKCKIQLRNHYFKILHQLEYNDLKEISPIVSTSLSKEEAKVFSKGKKGIVINFWKCNSPQEFCEFKNCPTFIDSPFPKEQEESIFGAIFPHYIYSIEYDGKILINPNIPQLDDYDLLFFTGFEIDQTNFQEKLKKMTSYQSYLENRDGNLLEKK